MARRDERSRTTRAETPLTGGSNVQLQPNRRNFNAILGGSRDAERMAAALTNAFGVGTNLAIDIKERNNKKYSLAGQQAAIEGRELTPEEQQRDSFMVGYQEVLDDRASIEIKAEAVKRYQEMDTSNLDSAGVAKIVDDIFKEQYEGIDLDDGLDRASMERMLPRIEAIQQALIEDHQKQIQQKVQDDVDMSVGIAVQHELETTGTLDLVQWNRKIVQIYGGKAANDELIKLVGGIAVREGRPELLEELQSRKVWKNHSAAPGGIRRYDQQLQNLKLQAENQKARNEADDEVASLKVTKAENEQYYSDVTLKVLTGKSAEQAIIDGLANNMLTGAQAQALSRFAKGYGDSSSTGEPKYDKIWDFRVKLMDDKFNLETAEDELMKLASTGALGDAESRRTIVEQELAVIQRRRAARLRDASYATEETELKGNYAVENYLFNTDPRYRKQQAGAVSRMAELVLEGTPTEKAREQALNEYPVPGVDGSPAITKAIAAVKNNLAPETSLISVRKPGESMPDFLDRLRESGINPSAETLREWANQ